MKKLMVLAAVLAMFASSSQLVAQGQRYGYAASQGSSMGSSTTAMWVGGVAVVAAGLGAWGISSSGSSNNAH